jgi:predicted ferric reductase
VGAITRRLGTTLKVGEIVRVQGPFGRFGSRGGKAPQIWVAGGIGITPFAALIGGLKPDHGPIEIFYTFRGEANAPHLEELRDRVLELPNVTLHTCDTATSGRLDAGQIVGAVGFPIAKARVLFCGPVNLRQELVKGLGAHGVPRRRVHYEEFEIRSDVWPLQFINVPAKTWMAKIGL